MQPVLLLGSSEFLFEYRMCRVGACSAHDELIRWCPGVGGMDMLARLASILFPFVPALPCLFVQQLPVFGKVTLRLCWLVPRMKLSTYCTRPDGPTFPRHHCEHDNPRWIIRSHHKINGWSLLSFFPPGSWSCSSIQRADSTCCDSLLQTTLMVCITLSQSVFRCFVSCRLVSSRGSGHPPGSDEMKLCRDLQQTD